ncbi:MAG: DivIVA domain-containing protein [Bacteroidia bacterium]|jgi:cell division initiation protein|nr:DivIVA domain-containing protein [Bacteroidia bacterium]GIV23947.1 MAG: septum formation initiator [Bacteroidia bacterium]
MLTPIDIQNQTFNKTLRGYDPEEVKTFLRQVAQEWAALLEEKHQLRQKVEQLTTELQRYKEMEALLQKTLLQAEETSRSTLHTAEQKAALLIAEAQQKAQEILAQTERRKEQLEEAIRALQQRRQDILLELRSFLTLQLEKLEQLSQVSGSVISTAATKTNTPVTPPPLTTPPPTTHTWAAKIAEKL